MNGSQTGVGAPWGSAPGGWGSASEPRNEWQVDRRGPGRIPDPRRVSRSTYVFGAACMVVAILGASWFAFGRGDAFPLNAGSKRPYIEAMVVSARASGRSGPAKAETTRCVAAAIVHGYGISAFAKAGLTPTVLSRPQTTLHALAAPTDAQVAEIGTAAQLCGEGQVLAPAFGKAMHVTDKTVLRCVGYGLNRGAAVRPYVVAGSLGRAPELMAAHSVVQMAAKCVRLAQLALGTSGLTLTAAEKSCILASARPNGVMVNHLLAQALMGKKPNRLQYQQLFSAGITQCVTAARRAHIAGK